MFSNAKQAEVASVPVQPSPNQNFFYEREAAIKVILYQSLAVILFIFSGGMLIGWKFSSAMVTPWGDIFSNSVFWAWLGGIFYFGYSLWRWSKLAWLENMLGVNLDKNPSIGNEKQPTMFIKIQLPNGNVRSADTGMPQDNKRFLMAIASATINGQPNSQQAMRRSARIPRPKHEKAMAVFVQLGVLQKESPTQANSRYVIAEPVDVNTAILRAVANGEFEMLKDVWARSKS